MFLSLLLTTTFCRTIKFTLRVNSPISRLNEKLACQAAPATQLNPHSTFISIGKCLGNSWFRSVIVKERKHRALLMQAIMLLTSMLKFNSTARAVCIRLFVVLCVRRKGRTRGI